MGRLDDAAKHKVVELRKAGLSFRKIKAVLELENIKVSAQAIYLFLREFQGRPPGRVRPAEAGSSSSPAQMQPRTGPMQESWSNVHLQNLLRDSSHHAGFPDFPKQTSTNPEAAANSSGPAENVGGSRSEQQQEGNKEENDIQIVSVTSLAQQRPPASRPEAGAAFMRRRVTASPATSSMLAARKRLLDKALSHRMKSFQQVASLLRRDQSSVQGSDLRSALPETYDLTSDKTVVEAQPGGGSAPRRFLTQRPGVSVRSLHPPPRVGIRLPNRPLAALASSGPGAAVIRLHAPGRGEGNPSPQQVQDGAARGLPDQIQALGSEVRSLSLAVKMLVEQQCRLEREQVQQTQVQKQILSTLQTLASRVGQCSSVQQQQTKTPSPSAAPSFSQDSFSFSQSSYGQSQPAFSPLEALETSEAFKLPGLSPASMNGFPPCSSAESLPLSHSSPQPQPFYSQQSSLMSYSQPYSTFSQPQTFRAAHSKTSDFSSCSGSSFQDCSVSTASLMTSPHPTQDQQVSSIKVEGP